MAPISVQRKIFTFKPQTIFSIKKILHRQNYRSVKMPISENRYFKAKKYNTLEGFSSKYHRQVNHFKETNSPKKVHRPKDNDLYTIITFYDSIPGWYILVFIALWCTAINFNKKIPFKTIGTLTIYLNTNFKTNCWCWSNDNVKYSQIKVTVSYGN